VLSPKEMQLLANTLNNASEGPWAIATGAMGMEVDFRPATLVSVPDQRIVAQILAAPEDLEVLLHARTALHSLMTDNLQLRQLVQAAYVEGYGDALLRESAKLPHVIPFGWGLSDVKQALDGYGGDGV
jgi:hypothetical protein